MARKKRDWYENACYHITCRGNHRNDIFKDDSDFGMYLEIINNVLSHFKQTPYMVASYCLMDNHVHLLLKTSSLELGPFMKRLNMLYAIYFNKKYHYIGHLFQDRFFSEIIADDTQLLETSRYIHLNPVRAKMVIFPEDYAWSSYKTLIGLEAQPIVASNIILQYWKPPSHLLYQQFTMGKLASSNP
ncbi:MAG: transposase [Cellulosilyticaceae bacterium]